MMKDYKFLRSPPWWEVLLYFVVLWLVIVAIGRADEPIMLNTKSHQVTSPLTIDFSTATVLGLPAVTLPPMSANSRLLGSNATGAGAPPSEITLGTNLSMTGSTLNAVGGTPGGSNTQVQFNDGGAFGGNAGMTYTKSIPKLTLSGNATTDSRVAIGNIEIQPYAVNNGWFSDNIYFDGSNFRYRANGSGGLFYFEGPEGQFRFAPTGTAGGLANVFAQFKVEQDGTVAIGGQIASPAGSYSGSEFLVKGTTPQIGISSGYDLGWTTTVNDASATIDTALARNSAGVVEIDNGTAGQYRDLAVRNIDLQSTSTNGIRFENDTAGIYFFSGGFYNTGLHMGGSNLRLTQGGTDVAQVGSFSPDGIQVVHGAFLGNGSVPTGGTTGQVLAKNSNTNYDVGWTAGGGGGTPGGANTNIQYNDSGAFGGDANLTWNKTTFVETLTGNQNAVTDYLVQNNNAGGGAQAVFEAKNGTYQANYGITGTGLTTSGDVVANEAYLYTDATNGLALFANVGGGLIRFAPGGTTSTFALSSGTANLAFNIPFGWTSSSVAYGALDTGLARAGAGGVEIDNGTPGQYGWLVTGVRDNATSTIINAQTMYHQSTATPAAGFGTGFTLAGNDSTTAGVALGDLKMFWTTATHNSNVSDFVIDLTNGSTSLGEQFRVKGGGGIQVGGALATSGKILQGDGTAYKASTPNWPTTAGTSGNVVKSDGTNFLSATDPGPAAPETLTIADAGTTTIVSPLIINHNTSGTAANGFGAGIQFQSQDSTSTGAISGKITSEWTTATHGLNVSQMVFSAVNGGSGGSYTNPMTLAGNGLLSVGALQSAAYVNAVTGYRYNGSANANKILRGDGTNFVASTPSFDNTITAVSYSLRSDGSTGYFGYPQDVINSSTTGTSSAYAADTYLAGSNVTVAAGDWKAKGQYHCVFDITKTGAGTATPIITVRIGTGAATTDTAILTYTLAAGTAVADTAWCELFVNFRTVGSGTSAVAVGTLNVHHTAATGTGFTSTADKSLTPFAVTVSSGFASNAATNLGVSFNGGSGFVGSNNQVIAQLTQ